MATSVFGGSPVHHNRNVHNSNGLSNAHNQINSENLSYAHAHPSYYHEAAHILPHKNFTSLKHSKAFPSIVVAQQSQSYHIPPILPKKMKKTYRTIVGDSIVHCTFPNDAHFKNTKRKSAVELLAESKPYYVKSENVLDKKQQLLYQSGRTSLATKSNSNIANTCK